MEIDVRQRDGVAIAALKGRLAAGVGDEQLRQTIDTILAEGRTHILLDLSGVTTIDSSGVGELVAGLKVCNGLGAKLKILQIPDRVEHALGLGQMLPLFDIHDDEDSAMASFSGAG